MSNIIRSTTKFAQHIIRAYIPNELSSPFTAVDATCGNGHDTLALARMLWPEPSSPSQGQQLLAFDIQKDAVASASELLTSEGYGHLLENGAIRVICDSHENIAQYAHGHPLDLVVYNLGYLPGGDKSITTTAGTTMNSIKSSIDDLQKDGLICITMYSGHPAGAKEKAELLAYAGKLDSSAFHVSYINMINQRKDPPEILLITRKK